MLEHSTEKEAFHICLILDYIVGLSMYVWIHLILGVTFDFWSYF